ncbi:MAG: cell division protein FtsZ [Minwuia sp.]|nr:cell division protein FtsZ [Minwuia sp.]
MAINLTNPELTEMLPRIVVFGVGGAGGNAVNNMIESELQGVEFVAANTDAQALAKSKTTNRIQLGAGLTQGLGAGAQPDVGRQAAEEAMALILENLEGAHMCFITAGMGGGTGTGAAPVIARAARENGVLTVGVVTKPFQFEGKRRLAIADAGVRELQASVDTLIVIPNQNLFKVATDKTTFADAFKIADEVLHSGVRSITDLMVEPGLINLDFADVRTVMNEMGKAMMGTGEAEGENRAEAAASAAIANPLLEDMSLSTAQGVLVNVTGGMDLTLHEVDEAANLIREQVDEDANIIIGSILDPSLDGKMRVSIVATGIDVALAEQTAPQRFTPHVIATSGGSASAPSPVPTARPMNLGSATTGGGMATALKVEPEMEPELDEEVEGTMETVGQAESLSVVDDVADHDIFATPVPDAVSGAGPAFAADTAPAQERTYEIPSYPARNAPEPRHIPASQTDMDDGFLAPPAQTARTIDTAPATPVTSEVEAKPRKSRGFFDRLRGKTRVSEEAQETSRAKSPLFPNRGSQTTEDDRAEPMLSGLSLPEAEPRKPASTEDDLDIPAFLRRQAN